MGAVMLHPEARAGLRNQLTDPLFGRLPWPKSTANMPELWCIWLPMAAVDGEYDEAEVRLLQQMQVSKSRRRCSKMPPRGSNLLRIRRIGARGNRLNAGFRTFRPCKEQALYRLPVVFECSNWGTSSWDHPKIGIGLPRSGKSVVMAKSST